MSGPPADRAEQRSSPSPWGHRGHSIAAVRGEGSEGTATGAGEGLPPRERAALLLDLTAAVCAGKVDDDL